MKNKKEIQKQLDRRSFLQVTALAGGGVMFGLVVPQGLAQAPAQGRGGAPAAPPTLNPNFYIKVNPDISIIGYMTEKEEGTNIITRAGNKYPLVAQGWNHVG